MTRRSFTLQSLLRLHTNGSIANCSWRIQNALPCLCADTKTLRGATHEFGTTGWQSQQPISSRLSYFAVYEILPISLYSILCAPRIPGTWKLPMMKRPRTNWRQFPKELPRHRFHHHPLVTAPSTRC